MSRSRATCIQLWLVTASVLTAAVLSAGQDSGARGSKAVETHVGVRIDGHLEKAILLFQPKPEYPPEAVKAGLQGTVRVEAVVGRDGSIKKLKVASGDPVLAKAASDAVSRWRYKPTLVGGKPVEVLTEIYVNFKLPKRHK